MNAFAYQYPDANDPRNEPPQSPSESSEQALADWHTYQRALHDVAALSGERLLALETALGGLYRDAEARRDSAAMQQITDAWGRAQQLHETITRLDAAVCGAGETIRTLNHQRVLVLAELETLAQAIEDVDTLNPRLADFAGVLIEDGYEAGYDAATDEVADTISEEYYDRMFVTMRRYGFDRAAVERLLDLLEDHTQINEEQAEWLRMFVDSLPREGDAS